MSEPSRTIADKDMLLKRIVELEAQLSLQKGLSDGFSGALMEAEKRAEAMAALLDEMPHRSRCDAYPSQKAKCPACTWAKLKEKP